MFTSEFLRENYICGHKFRDLADFVYRPGNTIPYNARVIFTNIDYYYDLVAAIKKQTSQTMPATVVTHNGDNGISPQDILKLPICVKQLFSQNNSVGYDTNGITRLHSLPIGIANSEWAHGQIDNFVNVYDSNINPTELAYFSVKKETNLSVRQPAYDYFSKQSWCQVNDGYLSPVEYYRKVRAAWFNMSPNGNGGDCHRHWETLYLGRIPVVERSPCMRQFENEDVPFLFVDNLLNVTRNFLDASFAGCIEKFNNYDWENSPIFMPYWKRLINPFR